MLFIHINPMFLKGQWGEYNSGAIDFKISRHMNQRICRCPQQAVLLRERVTE